MFVLPFYLVGIVFIIIGFIVKHNLATQKDMYKTVGELIGFREIIEYHDEDFKGPAEITDYDHIVKNSRPLFKFSEGSRSVTLPSEFSTKQLSEHDIGKKIPIICFKNKDKGRIKVIMDNTEQKKQFKKGTSAVFWFFSSVGIICIALGIMVMGI